MSYEIKILTDNEFDSLPYPEASMSLGLADTNTGKAYVRYTASDELNKYLINHELEHLTGDDRDDVHHGGDGVYYKGFGNIFQGIGQAAQGAGRSISGAAGSISRGVSGLFGGGQQQSIPQSSFLPKSPSPPMNIQPKSFSPMAGRMDVMTTRPNRSMQGFSPDNGIRSLLEESASPGSFGSRARQTPKANFSSFSPQISFNGFGSGARAGISQGFTQPPPPPQSPIPQVSQSIPQQAAPNIVATSRPGANPLESIFGPNVKPGQLVAGTALAGFGQFAGGNPQVPDISQLPSVRALSQYNIRNYQELDPALVKAINNDFDRIDTQERERLIARYKSLRPGADIESDSNFRRDLMELERSQGSRREDSMAKYRFEYIKQQLGISELEMKQLETIAGYDIYTIMTQLGLDAQGAQNFKDTFGTLGGLVLGGGSSPEQVAA